MSIGRSRIALAVGLLTDMNTTDMARTLAAVDRASLGRIPPAHAAKIVRRIVDGESLAPRLDVAAFNSAT